jgi:hypothetical protein
VSETKTERIEAVNKKIVYLMLMRAKERRHGTWAKECEINDQIAALELQIKSIRAEGRDVEVE